MAINSNAGGLQKPLEKSRGILWYADAGSVDISTITATSDLTTDFTEAGGITTDGITLTSNSEDSETYVDFNGIPFDSSEAVSTPQITFALLEVLSERAAKLVYADAAITAGAGGMVDKIRGTANPSNKTLVLDTRIKNRAVRVIFPVASFASRGDDTYATDALYFWEATYSILADENGDDIIRLFGDVV